MKLKANYAHIVLVCAMPITGMQKLPCNQPKSLRDFALKAVFCPVDSCRLLAARKKLPNDFDRDIARIVLFENTIIPIDTKIELLYQFAQTAADQQNSTDQTVFTYCARLLNQSKRFLIKQPREKSCIINGHVSETQKKFLLRRKNYSLALKNPEAVGITWLIKAITDNHKEAAEFFLECGANIEYPSRYQYMHVTPLYHACRIGNRAMVSMLIEHGASIILPHHTAYQQPLFAALANRHKKVAKLLLQHIANPLEYLNTEYAEYHHFAVTLLDEIRMEPRSNKTCKWLESHGARRAKNFESQGEL